MYRYNIIIYYSKSDNCYATRVPELPGCFSDGETYQEALENTLKEIDEWIEDAKLNGWTIPEPATQVAEQVARAS